MDELDYKLCYIEGHKAYFTSDWERQWGDDWNDRPYECNAGEPYEDYIEDGKCIDIPLATLYFETGDWTERKPCDIGRFSVEEINMGAVAWLSTGSYCIQAGTTMRNFIDIIKKHEGEIYLKQK